ncbi:ABC transporter ATP-binding protein [Candidatus Rhodobacter oscarellae]|uniref:ABC transporter ATP-binding protein n=1 Tax=Candidatus Rhodobacter oscarellae TaxID=1675527 RepID=A0A0J9EAY7_9RHOB|nr:ABC transporter ATP-binding protein [Candidatus Rhodobacter lobularis]KMW59791.1 ABC transporter ATP-binding protein [Candidatus Rhodobacter lobularis]
MTKVLELRGITKRFGALTANDDISLELQPGEILALLGENGAGKTTLMNILFGHYAADEGSVHVFGQKLPPGVPRKAIEAGVGMVHQHFTLAGNLSVLENVMLGSEPLRRIKSARAEARAKLLKIAERFGLPIDPEAKISALSVGERQRVEILKALYRDARILILDEPTAVLARPEAQRLFETLRDMTKEGLSLIFISHKLREVMTADRVAVLRGGKLVAERNTADTSPAELAELMVGRKVERPTRADHRTGAPVMSAVGVSIKRGEETRLDDVNFTVHEGEILGIVGVSGNGQAALGALLSGLVQPSSGELRLRGADASALGPRGMIRAGVGRVPEDRHAEGVVGELSVWENAVLERLKTPQFSKNGFVRQRESREYAERLIERFDIRGASADTRARLLSGGNMQKLILGRVLSNEPSFVLANQPTRGLDEGAIASVHTELLAAREKGAAILLISEELEEAVALSDRIQAIVKGRLSAPIEAKDANPQRLGLMMAGAWDEDAHAT